MPKRELPYVFRDLPDCPDCGSVRVDVGGGTVRSKDGSKCQYAECLECETKFKIIWDIPLGGRATNCKGRMKA